MTTISADNSTKSNVDDNVNVLDKRTSSKSEGDYKERKPPLKWWQNPTTITLLVAIVASVAPLTTGIQGYFQANNQLKLENKKYLHTVRQVYLQHVLSEKQNRRVLEFLVAVEDDRKLRNWAELELINPANNYSQKNLFMI